jgi:hypothetical protein
MRVVADPLQVAGAASIHDQRFVASAAHLPEELAPMIQPQGVTAQQPAHACHQMALGCFHHQMEMIAHQTVGVNLEIRLLAGLGQSLEKFLAIHLVVENVLPAVPTTHDVVNGAWILDAQLARHGGTLHPTPNQVKPLL